MFISRRPLCFLNIARPRLTRDLLTAAASAVVVVVSYWFWQRALRF